MVVSDREASLGAVSWTESVKQTGVRVSSSSKELFQ